VFINLGFDQRWDGLSASSNGRFKPTITRDHPVPVSHWRDENRLQNPMLLDGRRQLIQLCGVVTPSAATRLWGLVDNINRDIGDVHRVDGALCLRRQHQAFTLGYWVPGDLRDLQNACARISSHSTQPPQPPP